MSIRVLSVGKRHESWVDAGIDRFVRRLKKPFDVSWLLIPHSAREGNAAREEESARILERLSDKEFVILLDERGTNFTSSELATKLNEPLSRSQPVTCIIGGAYGVNEALRARADTVWSLSGLVFPHQLVRLILVEQLYRSQEILAGRPYHHV